jgi:predicted amidohydrolase
MTRSLIAAAIQFDGRPAPAALRLEAIGNLVETAAGGGANLVILPELFNTGYSYSPDNYIRAEYSDGLTAIWMRNCASRLGIHLAGTFLRRDRDEIYNTMLLVAPDGRNWRYDKSYPWGWERAYFRNGRGIQVAQTGLGNIGMLICWDIAHPALWRRFAGQIDLLVISSCPPQVTDPIYHLPGDVHLTFDNLGFPYAPLKGTGQVVFMDMLAQQTGWLGVPAVSSSVHGQIYTAVPGGFASMLGMSLTAPGLWRYLPRANHLELSAEFTPATRIFDRRGNILSEAERTHMDACIMAEIDLPEARPMPQNQQPSTRLSRLAYWISDYYLPGLCTPIYLRNKGRKS